MAMVQALLSEFDQEMKTTRRVLERVPDDRLEWQPHPRSMSMGRLASHVADLLQWADVTLQADSFDMNPPGGPGYQPTVYPSREAMLAAFDGHVVKTRQILSDTPDSRLGENWTLESGGQPVFTMPKGAVLRAFVFNHIVHHRGQLSVYLRENDVPVPSIYGPSADEGGM